MGKKRIKSLTIDYCKDKRRTERIHIQKTDELAQDYLLNNLKQTLTDEDEDSIEGEITLMKF